jgi:hypothetical protein
MMFMQEQALKEVCKIEIQRLEKNPSGGEASVTGEEMQNKAMQKKANGWLAMGKAKAK